MSAIDLVKNWNWVSVAAAGAGIWAAHTARLALSTWKRQIRAQLEIKFLDDLTDSVHTYTHAMGPTIDVIEFVENGIQTCSTSLPSFESMTLPETPSSGVNGNYSGVINYITANGKDDQEQLKKYLDIVRPAVSRMDSLAVKGQVFGFPDYSQGYRACAMLAYSWTQIELFNFMLGNPRLAQQRFEKFTAIKAELIRTNLTQQNAIFLEFAQRCYKHLLG